MTKPGAGHVFVVNGDLKKIACDAWLLPTDATFHVTPIWANVVDLPPAGGHMTGLQWDGNRVLRWTDNGDSPMIWLGDIGAINADPDWYCAGLSAFVEEAARAIRSAPSRSARPRLAVNLMGSGRGGLFEHKGALVKELLACSYRVAVEHDVDLILVTWGIVVPSKSPGSKHERIVTPLMRGAENGTRRNDSLVACTGCESLAMPVDTSRNESNICCRATSPTKSYSAFKSPMTRSRARARHEGRLPGDCDSSCRHCHRPIHRWAELTSSFCKVKCG